MTLSKERLISIAVAPGLEPCDYEETYSSITTGEIQAMARELLERRERDKQEPYGYVHQSLYEECGSSGLSNDHEAYRDGSTTHIPLYAAPPAPVVPDEQHSERFEWTFKDWAEHLGGRHQNNDPACYYEFGSFLAVAEMLRQFGVVQQKVGWNACRAAALNQTHVKQPASNGQSFGNSEQLNSPVAPDGWISVCDQMPDQKSERRVCVFTPTPHEDMRYRFVPASLFKAVCSSATHWYYIEPPSAPKQESE